MSEDIEPYFRHNESHGLEVMLTRRDEAALSLAIKDAVPEMRIMSGGSWDHSEPPYLDGIECRQGIVSVDLIPWDTELPPRVVYESDEDSLDFGKWFMPTDYPIGFMYLPSKLIYGYKPESDEAPLEFLQWGRFLSSQARGHERATQIRRKVWRTVKKLMSNKIGESPVARPNDLQPAIPAIDFWTGHDGMAWALESPRRFFSTGNMPDFRLREGWDRVTRLRPASEYTPPAGKWHRELRARLEERYGPGLRDLPRFHRGPPNPNKFLPVI